MKQETTIVKYIQDIYVALLYIWFIQKAEMVYIFARLAEQNNHLNEFGKANIKLHNYRRSIYLNIRFELIMFYSFCDRVQVTHLDCFSLSDAATVLIRLL